MKLDSVRELKQLMEIKLLPRIQASAAMRADFGRSATLFSRAGEPLRSVALGVAPTRKGDFRLAVRVQKRALEDSRELAQIAKQAKGEVDVRYVGRVSKNAAPWMRTPTRPLLIGSSVAHFRVTAGSLGCFVRRKSDGGLSLLSNNHVLANENRAKPGDAILQPGPADGGNNPSDAIGSLREFVRLQKSAPNFLDCALADLNDAAKPDLTKLTGLGRVKGLGEPFIDEGLAVAKIGRTTGLTRGRVTAFEIDNQVISYDLGDLRFDNLLEIEGAENVAFSDGGDSGALIVNGDLQGVALLFAGSDQGGSNGKGLTYANPLHAILEKLQVELALI